MRKLLRFLGNYKKESILGPLFKLLEASFELFVPLVVAGIIDTGIKNQDKNYVLVMGGLLLLLGVIGLICSITAQYFAAKAAVGFGTELRNHLFAHLNRLSYQEIDEAGTATLITRMTSDINQVQSGVNLVLRLFLRSPFIVFGAMIMAFTVNVKVALVFVVTIPVLSIVVFGIMAVSMPLYKKVQARLDRITLATRETLVGVRVIRAFNQQKKEEENFEEENNGLLQLQKVVGRISGLLNPLTYSIINLGLIAVIWVGAKEVNSGVISQGEVVALTNYMSQILVELIKLANLIVTTTKAVACGNRICTVLEMKPSIEEKQTKWLEEQGDSVAVEFRHVSFAYGSMQAEALHDIHFVAKKGQTIGIIGGTGSGKSSVIHLIPRFYDRTSGQVLINGIDVKEYPNDQLREKIGIVPQKAVLFKGTIRDNMKWGKKDATDEEIQKALSIAQAGDFVKENGLDYPIQQGGKNLSGGQRQRLTIARALVKQPEILILDDSSSALDFATDAKLRKAIKEETKGMTVFLVSQRASSIRYADQILVLDDGKMAGIGIHEELLKTCNVYQEICLSQLSKEEVAR